MLLSRRKKSGGDKENAEGNHCSLLFLILAPPVGFGENDNIFQNFSLFFKTKHMKKNM